MVIRLHFAHVNGDLLQVISQMRNIVSGEKEPLNLPYFFSKITN